MLATFQGIVKGGQVRLFGAPPPEVDIATVSDQELVDIVHEVREEMWRNA